tara:strand:- start:771 stop:995 length:225 start_codon:yes stop_codon:yes gene_type:complete
MLRNIRHIQIKKVAYHPNLFKAIITYEDTPTKYDESDDIEYIKLRDLEKNKKVKFETWKNRIVKKTKDGGNTNN